MPWGLCWGAEQVVGADFCFGEGLWPFPPRTSTACRIQFLGTPGQIENDNMI